MCLPACLLPLSCPFASAASLSLSPSCLCPLAPCPLAPALWPLLAPATSTSALLPLLPLLPLLLLRHCACKQTLPFFPVPASRHRPLCPLWSALPLAWCSPAASSVIARCAGRIWADFRAASPPVMRGSAGMSPSPWADWRWATHGVAPIRSAPHLSHALQDLNRSAGREFPVETEPSAVCSCSCGKGRRCLRACPLDSEAGSAYSIGAAVGGVRRFQAPICPGSSTSSSTTRPAAAAWLGARWLHARWRVEGAARGAHAGGARWRGAASGGQAHAGYKKLARVTPRPGTCCG